MKYYFTQWKKSIQDKKLWEQRAISHIDPSEHEYYMAVPDECMLSANKLRDWCIQSLKKSN